MAAFAADCSVVLLALRSKIHLFFALSALLGVEGAIFLSVKRTAVFFVSASRQTVRTCVGHLGFRREVEKTEEMLTGPSKVISEKKKANSSHLYLDNTPMAVAVSSRKSIDERLAMR